MTEKEALPSLEGQTSPPAGDNAPGQASLVDSSDATFPPSSVADITIPIPVSPPAPADSTSTQPTAEPTEAQTAEPSDASTQSDLDETAAQEPIAMAILLGGMAIFLFAGWLSRSWISTDWRLDRPSQQRFAYKTDLNNATEFELRHLPGVGEVLAERIVRERGLGGRFRDLNDVSERVRGVGPKLCQQIAPYLVWGPPEHGTRSATARETAKE